MTNAASSKTHARITPIESAADSTEMRKSSTLHSATTTKAHNTQDTQLVHPTCQAQQLPRTNSQESTSTTWHASMTAQDETEKSLPSAVTCTQQTLNGPKPGKTPAGLTVVWETTPQKMPIKRQPKPTKQWCHCGCRRLHRGLTAA